MSQAQMSPTLVSNWPLPKLPVRFTNNPGFVPGFFLAVKYAHYDSYARMASDDV